MKLNEKKSPRFLVLDGPTGTELIRKGYASEEHLWTARAALRAPDLLKRIHLQYLRAGARMLTANTFRTSAYACSKGGLSAPEARWLTFASVAIAIDAISEFDCWEDILLAGSLAPLEDCYQPGSVPEDEFLKREHRQTASWLIDAGCDVVLVETMGTRREAVIAVDSARKAGAESVKVSFITDESGHALLGGDDLLSAARECVSAGADAVMVNCVHPEIATRALGLLKDLAAEGVTIGAYANASHMTRSAEGEVRWVPDSRSPNERAREYGAYAREWILRYDARIVGGCCGTHPEHIQALSSPELRR